MEQAEQTSFPDAARVEVPLLLELRHSGGSDEVRFLSLRLLRYFPQVLAALDPLADSSEQAKIRLRFQEVVRRAARRLSQRGEIDRDRKSYRLTEKGLRRAEAEVMRPDPEAEGEPSGPQLSRHQEAQETLLWLGVLLGYRAQAEFEGYDVVWRRGHSARLSHVFEVQVRGNVDSALSRLKRAHEQARSRIYLIVADERSARFAEARMEQAFPELPVAVIGLGELLRMARDLRPHRPLIEGLTLEG